MSSTPKEPKPTTAKSAENSEMEVDDAVANKSIETTDKSDAPNTSSTSVDKNVAKKKKIKSSSSNQSHKKMKKDPNKPEYPKVGYVRYMNVRREELRKDSPDMHHLDVTKKIGEEWMTMGEEKKQPYLDAAKQDKTRYKMEMKAYNKKLKKAEQESATTSKGKKKSSKVTKDVNTSESTIDESPKKKKKKPASTASTNGIESKPVQKSKSTNATKKTPSAEQQPSVSSVSLMNTPPPTPPQVDSSGAPIFGEIPIFTEKFLEHNRQMETELKKIRKMNTDYEQQNAVLEKHVENVRAGISKTNTEIVDLRKENDKLSSYLETLRKKLATQLRNLSIPSEPNGANIENIDKYMNDLYEMAKDNSHGPASLNKAKDLLRKVDLNIDLKAFHQNK